MLWWVAQMVATVLASFIQVGVKEWIFKNVPDICYPNQISHLTCPHNQVFFTASAVWWVVFFFFFWLMCLLQFFFYHHDFQGSHWSNTSIRKRLRLSSPSLRHYSRDFHPNASLLLATALPHFMDPLRQHACHYCWSGSYATCYRHQF